MFDPRSKHAQFEEYKLSNPLRKVKNPRSIRNFTKTHDRAKEVVEYPVHKQVDYKVKNMHETSKAGQVIDNYHWC